jgi:DNA-binding transcriptional LysR family regulator
VTDPVTIVAMIGKRELDLALAETTIVPDEPDWLVTPLSRHQGYFVVRAGHPLAAVADPTLEQILAFPLVLTGRLPPRVLNPLLRRSPALGASLKAVPAIAVESLAMMKTIAAASDAVALLTLGAIADELASERLVPLRRTEPWMHTHYGIVRLRQRSLSPTAKIFLDHVLQVDKESAALEAELAKRFAGGRKRTYAAG